MADDRPNIILITTDQQRGDALGIETPKLSTPNLDHLGKQGARFTRAYAESPSCIPARRSLMSGMAPAAHGMVGFQGGVPWDPAHTLAGELSKAGYQTQMIGKFHLWPQRRRFGFDHLQLAEATRGASNDYVQWLQEQHRRTEVHPGMSHGVSSNAWVGRPSHLPEHQMHTFWCIDQAMTFISKRDPSVPFFLNISFIDPHPPLTPPAFYYDRYIHRDLPPPVVGDWAEECDGPQKGQDPNASKICLEPYDMKCTRAAYFGMVNFIDDQIGRLIQFAGSLLRDALTLYTSDHGEMLGDHHLFRKCWPYEASARVPLLIRAPRTWNLDEQMVCAAPVGLQDIMPTLLDAAGAPIPSTCTGHSLLPILRGQTDRVRDVLHGEHAGKYEQEHGNHYITDGHFKFIWYSQTGREQLFNLDVDPNEMHDLALDQEAQPALAGWRSKLIEILANRPEGFTDGKQLIAGQPHNQLMPGYEPDKVFPFV